MTKTGRRTVTVFPTRTRTSSGVLGLGGPRDIAYKTQSHAQRLGSAYLTWERVCST